MGVGMSIGGIRKSYRTSLGVDVDSLGLGTMLPFFVLRSGASVDVNSIQKQGSPWPCA
jgi:hypothetical protein